MGRLPTHEGFGGVGTGLTTLHWCSARLCTTPQDSRYDNLRTSDASCFLLMLQRAQEAGVLTSQQADAAASGAVSVPNLLDIVAVNSLFTDPVEVVAFSDEEGIR